MAFVGLGLYSLSDSVVVIIAAFANICIQTLLIGLVWENLMDGVFTQDSILKTLQDWRVTYAHNPEYADPYTSISLGQAVCAA